MLTDGLNDKIDDLHNKWPWLFIGALILFGGIYLYGQYRTQKLQMTLWAMQILQLKKDLGITDTTTVINQALKGDTVIDTVSNLT